MSKSTPQVTKDKDKLVKTIEKKYGVGLRYKTDKELHETLKKEGVPSLSKLLKLIHSA